MTDGALARPPALEHVTRVHLEGPHQVTDLGLLHLARMPQLENLDLGGWHSPITDRGLEGLPGITREVVTVFAPQIRVDCWS